MISSDMYGYVSFKKTASGYVSSIFKQRSSRGTKMYQTLHNSNDARLHDILIILANLWVFPQHPPVARVNVFQLIQQAAIPRFLAPSSFFTRIFFKRNRSQQCSTAIFDKALLLHKILPNPVQCHDDCVPVKNPRKSIRLSVAGSWYQIGV